MREYSVGSLIDIGASLAPPHVELLAANGMARQYRKGERIYSQGEPAGDVCFLRSGQAKSVLINATGNQCLLRIHLPHSIMGLSALGTAAIREAEATAIMDAELIRIEKSMFRSLMAGHPDFARYVVELLVDRMSDFHHRVGDFLVRNVEQRLAQSLLSLSRPDPEHGRGAERQPVRLTHEELASLLNARRPTITAILNRFAADGLIAKDGRSIVVLHAERLAHLLPRHG